MKKLWLLVLLVATVPAQAAVRCSGTPCIDSSGGVDVSSTFSWTSKHCWGGDEGTANGLCIKSVGGAWSMVSEGTTADAFELTVSFGDHLADHTLTFTGISDGVQIITDGTANIDFKPGNYWVQRIEGTTVGTVRWRVDNATCFTSGLPDAACDTGFRRYATGWTRAVSGAAQTAMGVFLGGMGVDGSVTTTKTPVEADCGTEYTNGSDVDGVVFTLPDDPPAGCHFTFSITAAVTSNSFTIQPNTGETLIYAGLTCSALTNTQRGDSIHIVATVGGSGGLWSPNGSTGTWICVP